MLAMILLFVFLFFSVVLCLPSLFVVGFACFIAFYLFIVYYICYLVFIVYHICRIYNTAVFVYIYVRNTIAYVEQGIILDF